MALPDMFTVAFRRCIRRPSVAVAVLLTLGVGIGLCTSLVAVLNAVVWRPLPVNDPSRLLWIETLAAGQPDGSSPGLLFTWRERARTVASVAAIRASNATVDDERGLERIAGAFVTASYFEALGVAAVRGRTFGADLAAPGREPVVVLSHRLWERRYGAADSTIGQSVVFNGRPRTIIGVMPPGLDELADDLDWWAPLALPESQRTNVGPSYLDVIARLQPGVTVASAQAELSQLAAAAGAKADDGSIRGVRLTALADHVGSGPRTTLMLLFGAVLVFLAIACANVANLLLADGLNRRTEMAVRASLGASRAQLLHQLAMEALIVFAAASALGLILAQWGTDVLVALLPPETPRLGLVRIDTPTILFAIAVGLVSVLAGALLPALRGARVDVSALRARDGGGIGTMRLRRGFVVAQIALTIALAAPGALLLRSARALDQAPRGYDAGDALTATFTLPAATFPDGESQSAGFERMLAIAWELPGVTSAAIATRVPLAGAGAGSDVVRMNQPFEDGVDRQVRIRLVSPGYFSTMGIRLVEGRDVDQQDSRRGRRVVLVNETLARRLRQGPTLAGATSVKFALREFNEAGEATPWDVIGVVGDTFDAGPRSPVAPEIFVPLAQAPPEVFGWMGNQALLALRGTGALTDSIPNLRAAIAGAGLKIPLYDVRTLSQRFGAHLTRERVVSQLVSLLAGLGFLLSSLGLFAVITQLVRQRQRDTVLKLALGASPQAMIRAVMREGLWMAGTGLVVGLATCLATAQLFRSLLFGVGAADPATLTFVAAALAAVTCLATWWPARAIASLDLVSVLRDV